MPDDPKGPHSRACGIGMHEHGVMCHPNCPTCGGKALPVQYGIEGLDASGFVKFDVLAPDSGLPVVFQSEGHLRAYGEALLAEFIHWVSTNRAYNGAPDPGQSLYNEQINAALPTWAKEFLEERPTSGKHRRDAEIEEVEKRGPGGAWPEGDDRLCTMGSCYDPDPHSHGGVTFFEGHRRFTARWLG